MRSTICIASSGCRSGVASLIFSVSNTSTRAVAAVQGRPLASFRVPRPTKQI